MSEPSAVETIQGLYGYHRWANRRLFDVAAALGDAVEREMGAHFSVPTLRGMFAHLYGADWIWLERWNGRSPTRIPGPQDFPDLATLRERWDALENDQRAFVEALTPAALGREVDVFYALYRSQDEGREAGAFGEGALVPNSDWRWLEPGPAFGGGAGEWEAQGDEHEAE